MALLILSDIHGNGPALEGILQYEPSVEAIAFCGDAVDFRFARTDMVTGAGFSKMGSMGDSAKLGAVGQDTKAKHNGAMRDAN